jgi:hypothetical protein
MPSIAQLKRYISLEPRSFRRAVVGILFAAVVAAFVLSAFVKQIDRMAGIAIASAGSLALLGILLDRVAALTSAAEVRVAGEEAEARTDQESFIRERLPRRVRMCEYSAQSVVALLDTMSKSGATTCVQLLICHPLKAWGDYQEEKRVVPGIARLPRHVPLRDVERVGLRIRCYSVPGGLRGRNYNDELIVAGWYTYQRRSDIPDRRQIWGHNNALLLAPTSHPEGRVLRKMFNDVFDRMWSQSVTLRDAADEYEAERHPLGIDPDWLDAVSGPLPTF